MKNSGKLILATQFYPPDATTTAIYLAKIAGILATDHQVAVISATPSSGTQQGTLCPNPAVTEIKCWSPPKTALVRRAAAICLLAARMFASVLKRARSRDIVFCVTSPFTLPYTVLLAAKLRRAATVLLIYDLYPEALEAAGLIGSSSLTGRLIRFANALMFRRLDTIIVIGRDVRPLILKYPGIDRGKVQFIPNWPLIPIGYRPIDRSSRFRAAKPHAFIVGLCGNLGFTHSPKTIFDAARLLQRRSDIQFVLSGWGRGWDELCGLFANERLSNITILTPVPEDEIIAFLSAADLWVIPYRRNICGVSIPSRLYNILAVGRPVIIAAEPNSEGALVLREEDIGWVVPPENPADLAVAILEASKDPQATIQRGVRAARVAERYREETALARYRQVVGNVKKAIRR